MHSIAVAMQITVMGVGADVVQQAHGVPVVAAALHVLVAVSNYHWCEQISDVMRK